MTTINKAIADAKQLRPSSVTFTDERIAGWVWELEQKIMDEVVQPVTVNELGETVDATPLGSLEDVESWDDSLTAIGTYEKLYSLYAIAQVDFYMQEYEAYNNSANAFNAAFTDFKKWYIRKHGATRAFYWKGLM